MWVNYALTARWASVPGSIHGPKEPWFVAALVAASLTAIWPRAKRQDQAGHAPMVALLAGLLLLAAGIVVWFPPATWRELPFLDNWPARFQSTMDGLTLWGRGAPTGWQWHFLGGYYTSSDITVSLTALAALPVAVFGEAIGFHLLHVLLLFSLPLLVWLDLRTEGGDRATGRLAVGLAAITVTSWFSYYQLRSGDTNSLAGTVCTLAALTGSHAAARGRRWGGVLLVAAMALVNYCHAGFFLYAALLLGLEAALYRDKGRARRLAIAVATGLVAALPLTWESWRYPAYFTFNNVMLERPPFEVVPWLRKIYYNVEFLAFPHRWFNDFPALATILLPVTVWTAFKDRTRTGFYAAATLAIVVLMSFDTPELGYALQRPVHLLAVLPPVALAGFLVRQLRVPALTWATTILAALYLQFLWMPLPHIKTVEDADAGLIREIRTLDGALVLLENTFHRDMDVDPVRITERTPFGAHLEAYLAQATGKRFYAGVWDGWQWSRYRSQLLSGGAFRGRAIALVPIDEFRAELSRWGVRHLLVWSLAARTYLSTHPEFVERWHSDRWTRFEFLGADTRTATVSGGRAELTRFDPLGADVTLTGVRAGAEVVVRTNFYPAWTAIAGDAPVALFDRDGQLALSAPKDGTYVVRLSYPRRPWVLLLAVAGLAIGLFGGARSARRTSP